MSTPQKSSGSAGNGFGRAGWLKVSPGRLAILGVACLALANIGAKRDPSGGRGRGGGAAAAAAATPAAGAPAVPTTLTKSLAIDALVQALAMNTTPAAEKTLEQMVTGEIAFGAHARQAAQKAMINLAVRSAAKPSPESDAFLARIFSDGDEVIRVNDQNVYPATDLRNDTALVLAKIGSPGVRLALAKIYNQSTTPPATREAIEKVIRAQVPANFAAQVEVFRGSETPESLKTSLQKTLIKENQDAVKAALKLPSEDNAKPGRAGATPFSPAAGKSSSSAASGGGLFAAVGKMFGGGASSGPAAASPFGAMAPMSPAEMQKIMTTVQKRMEASAAKSRKPGSQPTAAMISPDVMTIEILSEMQKRQPVDLGVVARDLWNPDFVESVAKDLSESKADAMPIVSALASLPLKASREKVREILQKQKSKGPEDFAKMEAAAPAEAPSAAVAAGGNRRGGKNKRDAAPPLRGGGLGGMGMGGMGGMRSRNPLKAERQEVTEFGTNWYDPGTLVVLKSTVTYAERPPEKPTRHSMYPQAQRRMTPAMEKRLQEKEAKQKALEATYDWRDAIEKSVRQWDERLSAVAEEPPATGDKPAGDDDKSDTEKAKPAKSSSSSSLSKSSAPKTAAAAPAPTPAVAMPIAFNSGETIAKEYHQRWPQDLAANFGSTAPKAEPLSVDYVKLEEKGQTSKTLTHYQGVIANLHATKAKITRRKIENGTWLDALIKDDASHRTRSIDVIVTKEAADDDSAKKSAGDAQITVEILVVEIETPGPDASPSHGKKETQETTSTTSP